METTEFEKDDFSCGEDVVETTESSFENDKAVLIGAMQDHDLQPQLKVGQKVKVFKPFEGYKGIGIIEECYDSRTVPFYKVQFIEDCLGNKISSIGYFDEKMIKRTKQKTKKRAEEGEN